MTRASENLVCFTPHQARIVALRALHHTGVVGTEIRVHTKPDFSRLVVHRPHFLRLALTKPNPKNIGTLQAVYQLLRGADSEDEGERRIMLQKAENKFITSLTKVIEMPRQEEAQDTWVPAAGERQAIRDLYHTIQQQRDTKGDVKAIEGTLQSLQNVLIKSTASESEADKDAMEVDDDLWKVTTKERVDFDVPDVPEELFAANRARKLN